MSAQVVSPLAAQATFVDLLPRAVLVLQRPKNADVPPHFEAATRKCLPALSRDPPPWQDLEGLAL